MKYRFYYGPSGSGKSYRIKKDIISMAEEYPERNHYLIVPDQYTMQEQFNMVKMHENRCIMNIDVLSFGRLCHMVFNEVGQPDTVVLDDTGKNLILRKVSLDIEDHLEYIGSGLKRPGYIHQVKSAISEFMQYGHSPEDIGKLIEGFQGKGALKAKMSDLKLMYEAFLNYKEDHYITTEERLGLLAEAISKSRLLKDSVVVFDGFTGFTPIQNRVLSALLRHCEEVRFSFCIDEEARNTAGYEGELYGLTRKSISSVTRLCENERAQHLSDIILESRGVRFKNDELLYLEKNIFRKNRLAYSEKPEHIYLSESTDPRQEIKDICVKIKELTEKKGLCYRDIAIVTGALDSYAPIFEEMFALYEIPGFVDRNRHLGLNPFTEFIKSGLMVIRKNFSYESVLHVLRSGMTDISEDDIDRFDNYLMALGIRGVNQYKKEFSRVPRYMKKGKSEIDEEIREELLKINNTRKKLMDSLAPIMSLIKGEHLVSEMVRALYGFMEINGVFERLSIYQQNFLEQGDYVREKEYAQVYKYFCNMLEQLDSLLGMETLELDEFCAILEAGIGEIKIGVLPGQRDYVLAGDIERSRLGDIKVLFFAGVNDGIVPKNGGNGGIISDLDREFLCSLEVELSPSPRTQMFYQKLYLYTNLTKPSEDLFVSYSRTDIARNELKPSYLVDMIRRSFPEVPSIERAEAERGFDSSKTFALYYTELLRNYVKGQLNADEEKLLFSLYRLSNDEEINVDEAFARSLEKAAFYRYEPEALKKRVVDNLYGEILKNSISRLEKYAACAYAHFLKYGLHLEDRENFDVSRLDVGNTYHEVLQKYIEYINENHLKFTELTEAEQIELIEKILEEANPDNSDSKFHQDGRSQYRLEMMKQILKTAVKTIGYQLERGAFVPSYMEYPFEKSVLSENGRQMKITGKIDRIDTCSYDDRILVKVVDYKSGNKSLKLDEVYDGLSLQLAVYLAHAVDVIAKKYPDKQVYPAALHYYSVSENNIESEAPPSEEEIEKSSIMNLRLKGLSVSDNEIIEKLAGDFETESDVIHAKRKKDGELDSRGQIISEEEMQILLKYADYKQASLGDSILSGDKSASPCGKTACDYCDYKEVCAFDKRIEGYIERKTCSHKDIYAAMAQCINENAHKVEE